MKNNRITTALLYLVAVLSLAAMLIMISGCSPEAVTEAPDDIETEISSAEYSAAKAEYPQMAHYPDESKYYGANGDFDYEGFRKEYDEWKNSSEAQLQQYDGYDEGLDGMFAATAAKLLCGAGTQNRVCSPINIYMALSMLAEITDGSSRGQILELMGAETIDEVRRQSAAVWNANYCDDGAVKSILANSLWLSDSIDYRQETLDQLAANYYASSFSGKMGSAEYDQLLRSWLNEQTDGMLEQQADGISMDPMTVISLASTVNFRAKWENEFRPDLTNERVFRSPSGDLRCDFMNRSSVMNYCWGEGYGAVALDFVNSGRMLLVLPDEGVTVDELLADSDALEFMLGGMSTDNCEQVIVNLSVPRFDVSSDISLIEGLRALGITDVFSAENSDFSPLTDAVEGICVSEASHAARVTIDEEGCTAVAFTVIMAAGAARPPEETVDFVLDRPFIFVIYGRDSLPLFVGVVNRPV